MYMLILVFAELWHLKAIQVEFWINLGGGQKRRLYLCIVKFALCVVIRLYVFFYFVTVDDVIKVGLDQT